MGSHDKAMKVWDWELRQARNTLYNEILQIQENTSDTFNQVAQNLVYLDRRIPNQELAHRVAGVTTEDLEKVAAE